MKRFPIIVLSLLAMACVVCGCGNNGSGSGGSADETGAVEGNYSLADLAGRWAYRAEHGAPVTQYITFNDKGLIISKIIDGKEFTTDPAIQPYYCSPFSVDGAKVSGWEIFDWGGVVSLSWDFSFTDNNHCAGIWTWWNADTEYIERHRFEMYREAD